MSWFRSDPDPILDLTFGRLTWRKTRSGSYWDGRCVFPPTDHEIEVCIPGRRKGPGPAKALWDQLCAEYPKIQAEVEREAARECEEAQVAFGTPRLETLYFMELSAPDGEWKWIYRIGEVEVHADGHVGDPHSVFLVE